MAVIETGKSSKLILSVATGTSASGGTIYSNRTINNINTDATNAAVYGFGSSLAALQSHALGAIKRQILSTLVEE